MMDPVVGTGRILFDLVDSVVAVGERRVRVHFEWAFSEQLYLFAFNMQPLPAHLLEGPRLRRSPGATSPPGRWVMAPIATCGACRDSSSSCAPTRTSSRRPTIARLVLRIAPDATARINLLLAGETDVMGDLTPPMPPRCGSGRSSPCSTSPTTC